MKMSLLVINPLLTSLKIFVIEVIFLQKNYPQFIFTHNSFVSHMTCLLYILHVQ